MDLGTDSEDELPEGWEERVTLDGRVYYANHETKSTQWEHPKTEKIKFVSGELPYGWERKLLPNGHVIYIDNLREKTTYTDPRLAFAKIVRSDSSLNSSGGKFFNSNSNATAMEFLNDRDLSNQTAIITGGNRGLGYEIARSLSFAGCHVILACRDEESGKQACNNLRSERPYVNVETMEMDLNSLKSVKHFADRFTSKRVPLNMLFLNAAVFEPSFKTTENDIELMFQVNHLAQFYLTRLLIENITNTPKSRIIIIACESHRGANLERKNISVSRVNSSIHNFEVMQVYCNTKLCNILFATELSRRFSKMQLDVKCNSCHPGNLLRTKLYNQWLPSRIVRVISKLFTKTMPQAAATPIFCAVDRNLDCIEGGLYWNNVCQCVPSVEAQDPILGYRLWEICENLLIEKTDTFDTYLSVGDKFSSITSLSTPEKNPDIV